MSSDGFHLLRRFKRGVAKVRFLLSFNLRRWLLSSTPSHRRFALDSRPSSPGLLDLTDVADELGYYLFGSTSPPKRPSSSLSMNGSSSSPPPLRTPSPPLLRSMSRVTSISSASSDDINLKAEQFIENFHRQLMMERQISLQLRYCKGEEGRILDKSKSSNGL
ncbi:hypothetical protein KFK09_011789 [Dendrobium nobile]|uniref:Uncharacterized protein n=1 Tax=Dendrobium nobile TaxID=94219 RepID=A0A8T3BFK0_DENNO|nr:hypothetical protein KFK09_011789 [Dendrobium nobile]